MKTLFLILIILLVSGCFPQRPQVIYTPMYYPPVVKESVVVPLPYFYPYPQTRVLEKETIIQQVPQTPCNPCDTSEYDKRLKKYMEK